MRATTMLGIMILVAGCGGGLSVSGTIHGSSLDVADSASSVSNTGQAVDIFLADVGNLCQRLQMKTPGVAVRLLQLVLSQTDSNAAPTTVTAPGVFTIGVAAPPPSARIAGVVFQSFAADGTSVAGSHASGTSGSVELDSLDAAGAAGSAQVLLDTGETITVKFDHAPHCAL
jgi:hypothetical protein